jgi:superfamily II DNA or RNA helicase
MSSSITPPINVRKPTFPRTNRNFGNAYRNKNTKTNTNIMKTIPIQNVIQAPISTSHEPLSKVLENETILPIPTICSQSYIGKKGYTILKSTFTDEKLNELKKELTLKPVIQGPSFGAPVNSDSLSFPVYRENDKKIYIPRFYGQEKYGIPTISEIEPGDKISVEFKNELREYQTNIVNTYLKYISNPENREFGSGGILEVPCGKGKTVMALKIISILKVKTLILVHKEFLMNQWIERIGEFLPGANVGKIQGGVCDCEKKDIVIGMIQTMYHKTFPASVYSQFGLTIIDEVHRIGSEEFSKTLLNTVTKYMLGISATVERKDKLTNLLYMFIGPKIYSEERKSEDRVCVRGIQFKSGDPEFNHVDCDFRGNPKFSTMISKISNFHPRSIFIVRVIADLLKENPDAQIMVLAHNRSLLTYFYECIEHRGLGSVGYYVGGMKQGKLQETETKQIVLATYAMAAEALDIKSLSILVMASPKTDIVQSVGRILRIKHANPVVIDIIDSHDLFQNQWKQRKRYYKKCNYRIRYIEMEKYTGMSFDWDHDTTWLRVFEPKEDAPIINALNVNVNVSSKQKEKKEKKALNQHSESDSGSDSDNNFTVFGGKCCIDVEEL